MKKNLLFLISMLLVVALLFLVRATGFATHLVISVVGLIILVAYTIATKNQWKSPGVEILMRVFYAIALITGVVLMNVQGIMAVSIVHKISAFLFLIFLFAAEIKKL